MSVDRALTILKRRRRSAPHLEGDRFIKEAAQTSGANIAAAVTRAIDRLALRIATATRSPDLANIDSNGTRTPAPGRQTLQVNMQAPIGPLAARTGQVSPYPSAEWNTIRPEADGKPEWGLVQALWDDADDHLWTLDTGIARGDSPIPPKLVEFDLKTKQPIRTYTFEDSVTIKDALNDVRIDPPHQTAYLTAAGNRGGIVVLDLKSGHSRLVLAGDRSAIADPKQHLMIGGEEARRPNGSPVVVHTDGIALSPDARWLYYRPLNDHNYWRVPTVALRDTGLSEAALSQRVQYLGTAAMSGGLIMDKAGTLLAGDLEHATVVALTIHGTRMTSRVFVRAPGQLFWADGFAISGGDLYISDSHLNEVAFKNDLPRSGPFTIFKVRLPPG